MPRFYFHIVDGEHVLEDPDGTELADIEEARADALQSARHLLAERVLNGEIVNGQRFEIRDDHGKLLATVPFKDAIRFS